MVRRMRDIFGGSGEREASRDLFAYGAELEPYERDQDRYFVDPEAQTAVVADGVGGEEKYYPEFSRRVAEVASEQLTAALSVVRDQALEHNLDEQDIRESVMYRLQRVRDVMPPRGDAVVTGATLIPSEDGSQQLVVAHLGDTRAYILRAESGALEQVTQDHDHPMDANTVSKTIKGGPIDNSCVDIRTVSPGDRILLCSDGVYGNEGSDVLTDRAIMIAIGPQNTPVEAAQGILAISQKKDDKVAVVFDVPDISNKEGENMTSVNNGEKPAKSSENRFKTPLIVGGVAAAGLVAVVGINKLTGGAPATGEALPELGPVPGVANGECAEGTEAYVLPDGNGTFLVNGKKVSTRWSKTDLKISGLSDLEEAPAAVLFHTNEGMTYAVDTARMDEDGDLPKELAFDGENFDGFGSGTTELCMPAEDKK